MKVKNIRRRRGDTALIRVPVEDYDGSALNNAGATFKLTVDPEEAPADDANNVFQAVGAIADAALGLVDFVVPGDNDPGGYFYDVEMINAAGKKETILAGRYIITQDITK